MYLVIVLAATALIGESLYAGVFLALGVPLSVATTMGTVVTLAFLVLVALEELEPTSSRDV